MSPDSPVRGWDPPLPRPSRARSTSVATPHEVSAVGIVVTLLVFLAAAAPAGIIPVQLLGRIRRVAQQLSCYIVKKTHPRIPSSCWSTLGGPRLNRFRRVRLPVGSGSRPQPHWNPSPLYKEYKSSGSPVSRVFLVFFQRGSSRLTSSSRYGIYSGYCWQVSGLASAGG
jgi:hypothetical protein